MSHDVPKQVTRKIDRKCSKFKIFKNLKIEMEKFEIEVQTRINVKKNSLDGKKFCRNEIHFKLKICFSRKLRYQVSQFCRLGSVVRNSDMSVRWTLTKILQFFFVDFGKWNPCRCHVFDKINKGMKKSKKKQIGADGWFVQMVLENKSTLTKPSDFESAER